MDYNLKHYQEYAEILKALAHPTRLCIVRGLIHKGSCNVNTMQDCLEVPQPTVSRHLNQLKKAGIIDSDRKGIEVFYFIKNDKVKKIIEILFDDID